MNNQISQRSHKHSGMTLVEIMIAMLILTIMAAGIISAVFTVKADAENNLYESSALNVAMSFIEQMKSFDYGLLEDPPTNPAGKDVFTFIIGSGTALEVPLDEDITITVPIVSKSDGNVVKELDVILNVSKSVAASFDAYWLQVDYSWDHPTRDRAFGGSVNSLRSEVSTY
ncbi:type II secretion system protein [Rubellicoccus peritrichatus]|uniref:Type II secretion system protein n=1 Tax=Rubellicoccus peritrichatus TaxID=3080537 RepID=A0AAQ3L9S1_9BACT|nr:type II secretion system protein [Puniceicoccus sp. CR14]WOO39955.1 type II secretion system protein [Puniceicoccus sp. CR14]